MLDSIGALSLYLGAGTNIAALKRRLNMPTFIVAASDATQRVRGNADYVCDGTADDVQILAAMNALPTQGGTVILSEGNFSLTSALDLPDKSVRLVGQSIPGIKEEEGTLLTFTFGSTDDCIVPHNSDRCQSVERLGIKGDGSNTRYGIYLAGSVSFATFRDIAIYDMATAGVRGDASYSQCYFERVFCFDLTLGFDIAGGQNTYLHCQATRPEVSGESAGHGFDIAETGSIYINCFVELHCVAYNLGDNCEGLVFIGASSQECNRAISVHGGTTPPNGTLFIGGSHKTQSIDSTQAVRIGAANGTVLTGVLIEDTTSGNSFATTANSADTIVIGGSYDDATPITDGGKRTRIIGHPGYESPGDIGVITLVIDHASITDGGGATGYMDFAETIPAFSIIKTVKCDFTEAFNSDGTTTLTMMIGPQADLDAYNTTADPGEDAFNHTTDVFWVEGDCQNSTVTTAVAPRVTFTEDDDITHSINGGNAAGAVTVTITYMKA